MYSYRGIVTATKSFWRSGIAFSRGYFGCACAETSVYLFSGEKHRRQLDL